eukprot:TRINITY_DN18907_c0_g1_i2.p1 TRINITY_DN18907_c0_g1~~TRINITY_DN18907_c0_g1_i2.p1  ORF type:complete len:205 (-),score=48.34 TRINITY_DN18907_c0_g1_i2:273-887(-)
MGKKANKENDGAGGKAGAAGKKAPAFKMPEPENFQHVKAPAVLPPPLEEENDEDDLANMAYEEALPRKLKLGYVPLLKHPVHIGAIDPLLEEDECIRWIEWGEKRGFEEFKQKSTEKMAFRDNGRIEIDSEEVAHGLWLRIRPFVPDLLTGSGGTRRALGYTPVAKALRIMWTAAARKRRWAGLRTTPFSSTSTVATEIQKSGK